jgi:polyphosphate kinase 2 (PPK2 family)
MKLTGTKSNHHAKGCILDQLDQTKCVEDDEYKEKLRDYQMCLLNLQHKLATSKHALVLVFEGPDASGKGGAVKRIVEKLDPRRIRVHSTVKPTSEEYSHHYLWRFWTKLPPFGEMAIFDRSWYGRVLVERVEGFATKEEWKRAYQEINGFERTLTDNRYLVMKFYLHVTKSEQLDRFKKREADPAKAWKINEEDWRNREKWDEHNEAAEDMLALTASKAAPWYAIAANYKWRARLKVLKAICEHLEENLEV